MFDRIKEDMNGILERDPAARSRWEVLTCYPGLHAIIMHRWAYACWQHDFKWLGRFISQLARWFTGIEIHPAAKIGRRVFIDHGMGVVIGETAEVGDDCTIYQGVTLGGTTLFRGTKRHPTLGNGVIVGANAMVLGGFTVGDGAKIGSAAVVVKEVPDGATAVGNPARILGRDAGKNHENKESSGADDALGAGDATGATDVSNRDVMNADSSVQNVQNDIEAKAQALRQKQGEAQAAKEKDCAEFEVQGFSAYAVTQGVDPLVQAVRVVAEGATNHEEQINLLWDVLEKLAQEKGIALPEGARKHSLLDTSPVDKLKS